MLFKDEHKNERSCDFFLWVGKPNSQDEIPLKLVLALAPFEKWSIDFIRPIKPIAQRMMEKSVELTSV